MRIQTKVYLSDEDRLHLENLIRSGKSPVRTQMRARVLLATDYSQGKHKADGQVAEWLHIDICTVKNIRKRYLAGGIQAALYDKPRPGQAPKITGEVEAHLVALSCSNPPQGHSRWTLKLLADKLVELHLVESISPVAIYKRLKKTSSSRGRQGHGA